MKILTSKNEILVVARGSLTAMRAIVVGISHIKPMPKQLADLDKALATVEANDYTKLKAQWEARKLIGASVAEEGDDIVVTFSPEIATVWGNGVADMATKASTIIAPLVALIKVSGLIPTAIEWNKKMDSFFMTPEDLVKRDEHDARQLKLKDKISSAVTEASSKAEFDVTTEFEKNPDSVIAPAVVAAETDNIIDGWMMINVGINDSKFIKHPITGVEIEIKGVSASKDGVSSVDIFSSAIVRIIQGNAQTQLFDFAKDTMSNSYPVNLIQAIRTKYELPLFATEEVKVNAESEQQS